MSAESRAGFCDTAAHDPGSPFASRDDIARSQDMVYAASMTVPSGFTSDNLPAGITFFGLPYTEPALIRLAYAYEQATHHRVPPKTTPALNLTAGPTSARRDR